MDTKQLRNAVVPFKSVPANYDKEVKNIKPNTHRVVDMNDERFLVLAAMAYFKEYGKVEIHNTVNSRLSFRRQIRDITFWGSTAIISWNTR